MGEIPIFLSAKHQQRGYKIDEEYFLENKSLTVNYMILCCKVLFLGDRSGFCIHLNSNRDVQENRMQEH